MSADKRRLLELAARVSDGANLNWDEAEKQAADEEERQAVRRLRLVASISDAQRAAAEGGADVSTDETVLKPASGTPSGAAPTAPAPAALGRWGHLDLLEKLGEGSFGEVFLAWDARLERRVALKLLHARVTEDRPALTRILDEGRRLARVRHPNVVAVHGVEEHDGRVGLWMEYAQGRTLADLLLEQGAFSAQEAALAGVALCRALAAVHRARLVHRDVKCQNVMRAEGGRILLMDFGAGVELERHTGDDEQVVSGTPLYMAPEIVFGERATPQSDIYSLGVTLFHLVTCAYPVDGATFGELADRHRRREARLLRDERPDLPEAFVKVAEKALAWDPAARFATAGEMEQALASALAGSGVELPADTTARVRPGPWLWAAGAAAATVVVAIVAGYFATRTPAPPAAADSSTATPAQQAPAVPAADPSPATAPAGVAPAVVEPLPPNAYTVDAALYRVRNDGRRDRLDQGSRVALGDKLEFEFRASKSVFLYVIDEDELGHAYALFPLPDLELKNPLPPNVAHRVPGRRAGKNVTWTVDTPGGREHFMVLASPERLTEFEAEMNALARPRVGGEPVAALALSENARVRLRGIGALQAAPDAPPTASAGRLFDMARRLATRAEVVEGPWLRQIELENPAP